MNIALCGINRLIPTEKKIDRISIKRKAEFRYSKEDIDSSQTGR